MRLISFMFLVCIAIQGFGQILSSDQLAPIAKELNLDAKHKLGINMITSLNESDLNFYLNNASDELKEVLSEKRLLSVWKSITKQGGEYQESLGIKFKRTAEQSYYLVGFELKNAKYDLQFTTNDKGEFSSIMVVPFTQENTWKAPNEVDYSKFMTEEIFIGSTDSLLGEFTFPVETKNYPIVVMVHGSGPNDMDESLGPNKLFKDLAYSLATKGIGSIRYNKRSYDYPSASMKKMKELDFNTLIVEDAVKAIELAQQKSLDNVFLLGHSLGGHLAPRIADKTNLKGVIVMAGNASPLQELLLPQFEHLMKYDSSSGVNEFQINMLKTQLKNLEKKNFDENTMGPILPLGLPGRFWLSIEGYKPVKVALNKDIPYFVLSGERDYQVPPSETKLWKKATQIKGSKMKVYPGLNHMFFEGEGVCIPKEYENEAYADRAVVKDLVDWIYQVKLQ